MGAKNSRGGLLQAIAPQPPCAPARARSQAARVFSGASVPAASPTPRPPVPTRRARLSSASPAPSPAAGPTLHTRWGGASWVPGPFSPNFAAAGAQAPTGRVSPGSLGRRGLARQPAPGSQILNPKLREGRGLLGCAGSWPMGAAKGVAVGAAGALRISPPSRAPPDPREPCRSLDPWLTAVGPARLALYTSLRDARRPRALCSPGRGRRPAVASLLTAAPAPPVPKTRCRRASNRSARK